MHGAAHTPQRAGDPCPVGTGSCDGGLLPIATFVFNAKVEQRAPAPATPAHGAGAGL